jgi:sec-independent protein translocase protein TatA
VGIENPVHLAFIGIVALLVLGPKRLPELARALGHGIREFREAISTGEHGKPAAVQPVEPTAVEHVDLIPPVAFAEPAQQGEPVPPEPGGGPIAT